MLVDQRLRPSPKPVHDSHLLPNLRCEASDLLALNNRLVGNGVEKAREYGWAMAAVVLLGTTARRGKETNTAETTPPFFQTLAAIFLRFVACG
jgi:hypothetical protein